MLLANNMEKKITTLAGVGSPDSKGSWVSDVPTVLKLLHLTRFKLARVSDKLAEGDLVCCALFSSVH